MVEKDTDIYEVMHCGIMQRSLNISLIECPHRIPPKKDTSDQAETEAENKLLDAFDNDENNNAL